MSGLCFVSVGGVSEGEVKCLRASERFTESLSDRRWRQPEERERERGREGGREREGEKDGGREATFCPNNESTSQT